LFRAQTDDIVSVLDRLSKVELPAALVAKIRDCTQSYGIIKLVLRKNQYFVESSNVDAMETLLRDPTIQSSRVRSHHVSAVSANLSSQLRGTVLVQCIPTTTTDVLISATQIEDDDEVEEVYSFEVTRNMIDVCWQHTVSTSILATDLADLIARLLE
jgi:DNA excision repair protein ERCC-3